MTLSAYSNLIRCLPYLDQAFETKKTTWQRECRISEQFSQYCDVIFEIGAVKLSRRDCFASVEQSFDEALYSIIFWGYPRNMRGNSFSNILKSLPMIRDALSVRRDLNEAEFQVLCRNLNGTGLGLSTLSKLLYFFNFSFNGYPCLILDRRIIKVFENELFDELKQLSKINDFNKVNEYASYLEIMQNTALLNDYKADQLEFFLFHFGNNLKSENG